MKSLLIVLIFFLSQRAFSYVEALSLINKESYKEGYSLLERNYQETKELDKKRLMANVLAFAPSEFISGNPLGYALLALEEPKLDSHEKTKLLIRAGDLAFEQNKLGLAKINYLKGLGKTIEKEDLYVLYQLSWVLVNLGEYKDTLKFIEKGLSFGPSDYFTSLSENYGQFSLEALLHLNRVSVKKLLIDDEAFKRGALKSLKLIKTKRHFTKFERSLPHDKVKMLQKVILSNKKYQFLQEQYCKGPRRIVTPLGDDEIEFVENCKNPNLKSKLAGNAFLTMAYYQDKNKKSFCSWGMKSIDWKDGSPLKAKYNINVAKECSSFFTSKHIAKLVKEVNHSDIAQEAFKIVLSDGTSQKKLAKLESDLLLDLPKDLLIPLLASENLTNEEKLQIISKGALYLDKEALKSFSYYLGKVNKKTALKLISDDFFAFVKDLKVTKSNSFIFLEATKVAFQFNHQVDQMLQLSSRLPEETKASDKEYTLLSYLHRKEVKSVILKYNKFEGLLSKKPELVRELLLSEDWNSVAKENKAENKLITIGMNLKEGRRINGSYKKLLDDLELQPIAYPLYYIIKDIEKLNKKKRLSMAFKVGLLKKIKRHQKRVQKVAKEKNWLVISLVNKYNDYINMTQKLFKGDANEQVRLLANEIDQWKLEIN